MESCISHSREAELASAGVISYEAAVMGAFRTREAFATCRPFSVMILGFGSEYLYRDGVLCYLRGHAIHVLNVHEAANTEMVISLPPKIYGMMDCRIKLMSFRDNVLVILCIPPSTNAKSIILAINTLAGTLADAERIRLSVRVPRSSTCFIRHNARHVIYGLYSDTVVGWHGHREWQFWHFKLLISQEGRRLSQLTSHPGMDIGSTVVFEIFDDNLYVLSSQVTVDTEEQDPISYYHVSRYDLKKDGPEEPETWPMWRRQHREGPIHDSWTDLALRRDEDSGGLLITETRREWQDGHSKQKRTAYIRPLIDAAAAAAENFGDTTINEPPVSDIISSTAHAGESARWTPPPDPSVQENTRAHSPPSRPRDPRLPRHCHPEYKGDQPPSQFRDYRLAQTKYRAYNYSSAAFLDIVYDDQSSTQYPPFQQQIRFRLQSRIQTRSEDCFEDRGIRTWPPLDAPGELLKVLNPGSGAGELDGCSDERSVLYMAGSDISGQGKPIVLVNFDPLIRFPGLKTLDELERRRGNQNLPSFNDRVSLDQINIGSQGQPGEMIGAATSSNQRGDPGTGGRVSRFRHLRAMWQQIGCGYQLR